MLHYPNVDLFATQFNHKLLLYVSPVPDNHALVTDALSVDWNYLNAYAFPPTILIPSDISKASVSRWISYANKLAYRKLTRRDISFLKIKAHKVRVLSSSWAFFDRVPLSKILKAVVWNQSSTFAKFYLRECQNKQLISSPGLCPWRAYVVTQALASASVSVRLGISTMFKFSNVCIVF